MPGVDIVAERRSSNPIPASAQSSSKPFSRSLTVSDSTSYNVSGGPLPASKVRPVSSARIITFQQGTGGEFMDSGIQSDVERQSSGIGSNGSSEIILQGRS